MGLCGYCNGKLDTGGKLCRKCRIKFGINPDMIYDLKHFERKIDLTTNPKIEGCEQMVMKEYCDECGKELKKGKNRVGNRIKIKTEDGYEFQLLATNKDSTWNEGSLCLCCIKKLIAKST